MNVRQWLEITDDKDKPGLVIRPHALLKDGTSISIQCSRVHYCQMTENGIPLSVEVYIGNNFEELRPFSDDAGICSNVDIDFLDKILKNHGGIVGEVKE